MGLGKNANAKRAVVDIGSNSVRLVIYDGPARAPFAICNEKALCGLGREMSQEAGLEPNAVDYALRTLKRFREILDDHDSPPVQAIATAAVREASDGAAFVKAVKALDFDVVVVDGLEEARLAALGVVSYQPGATGVVGDMGGGSLELIRVRKGQLGEATSLSIGPLRMMQKCGGDLNEAEKMIADAVAGIGWLNEDEAETLYAVGGAWRAIARIHMRLRRHPLSVLHHYELQTPQAIEICDLVARQSRASLEDIPGIPKRRLDTLPYAALVMKAVLTRMKARNLFVSAGGVREGLLYDNLDQDAQSQDPLEAGAAFVADKLSPDAEVGPAVAALSSSLFMNETPSQARIRKTACLMMDVCAYFHPDLRGAHAFDTALRTPFYGVSHKERVAIATALCVRHDGRRATPSDAAAAALLDEEERQFALAVGLVLRFAGAFSPKSARPLKGCSLSTEDDALIFRAPVDRERLMEEFAMRRLQAVADFLELTLRIEFEA